MSSIKNMFTSTLFILLLVGLGACTESDPQKAAKTTLSPTQTVMNNRLAPPKEEKLFVLPDDRTFVHTKVSEPGNAVAFWVRRPSSVQLIITGQAPLDFKGHVGFQKEGSSFHVVQPGGKRDRLIVGPSAEKDAWLVWGPGKGMEGEPLDDYFIFDRTGNHATFALYDKGHWSWVLDNEPIADYHHLAAPVLSDKAKTIAWIEGSNGGSQRVVVNGKPEPAYDNIYESTLVCEP
uniref:Lipoprotein n=1 Tax=Candidatus Kentrum sp. LFY TaxID=2126342 RepID=A0A450UZS2_9GAMM|nr:MAG: hypothetical protein BECKLFY1418B_GA0070995_11135 [Candidatus Kentron sp. LFY]